MAHKHESTCEGFTETAPLISNTVQPLRAAVAATMTVQQIAPQAYPLFTVGQFAPHTIVATRFVVVLSRWNVYCWLSSSWGNNFISSGVRVGIRLQEGKTVPRNVLE